MEREQIIKLLGFNLITIWETDWKHEMNNFSTEYRNEIIDYVEINFIDAREALHGGRTETFKTYYECQEEEFIIGDDISSQYPAVMALDSYATGCKKICKYTVAQLTEDILNDKFTGLVKCDVKCPKSSFLPLLPSKEKGTLIFNLKDKKMRSMLHPN